MSETKQNVNLNMYLGLIGVAVVFVLLAVFWPSDEDSSEVVSTTPVAVAPVPSAPTPEVVEDTFTPPPVPEEVTITATEEAAPIETLPPPEPLDTSDAGLIDALMEKSSFANLGRFLINDSMLQRFVVLSTNLAEEQNAPNHQLLMPPEQAFRTYHQAGKVWIDAASYKRYTPYVDMLESFDDEALLSLYRLYQDDLQQRFAEIGDPDKSFSTVLVKAINTLLDTPEVPVPVEVYTDSVMYKYADPRLEELSAPKKQLLRTGPDNMRRIKAKLRALRNQLENEYR